MAKDEVQLTKTDSIINELEKVHDDISRRAYEFFCGRNGGLVDSLDDWFRAERELVRNPAIELRQKDGAFEIEASVAGIDAKDLDIQVTPQDILIKGHSRKRHDSRDGLVHVSEFRSGQLFRSIHLPQPIDPNSVKAEHKDGLLHLTARLAPSTPTPTKAGIKVA